MLTAAARSILAAIDIHKIYLSSEEVLELTEMAQRLKEIDDIRIDRYVDDVRMNGGGVL